MFKNPNSTPGVELGFLNIFYVEQVRIFKHILVTASTHNTFFVRLWVRILPEKQAHTYGVCVWWCLTLLVFNSSIKRNFSERERQRVSERGEQENKQGHIEKGFVLGILVCRTSCSTCAKARRRIGVMIHESRMKRHSLFIIHNKLFIHPLRRIAPTKGGNLFTYQK